VWNSYTKPFCSGTCHRRCFKCCVSVAIPEYVALFVRDCVPPEPLPVHCWHESWWCVRMWYTSIKHKDGTLRIVARTKQCHEITYKVYVLYCFEWWILVQSGNTYCSDWRSNLRQLLQRWLMLVFSADCIRSVPCLSVFQTLCTVKWNGLCPRCFVTTRFASLAILAILASVQKKIIGTFSVLPPSLCWNEFWS
jgi:hypothetical protein